MDVVDAVRETGGDKSEKLDPQHVRKSFDIYGHTNTRSAWISM